MTQQEKLQSLIAWLNRHHIEWHYPKDGHTYPEGTGLAISKPHIHVIICTPDKENESFLASKERHAKAFFIRETETPEFVIEKMRNCLHGYSVATVRKMEVKKAAPKRKRERIHVAHKPVYERVSR